MKSVDELFDLWPSMADLARDLTLPYPTVAAWKQRRSIPVGYWRDVILAARKRGHIEVDSDLLIETHDQSAVRQSSGFEEDSARRDASSAKAMQATRVEGEKDSGHFSRWKHLRQSHFSSSAEIADHIEALRSEWDRR